MLAPRAYFVGRLSMGVARVVPVEVHVQVLLEVQVLVPEELREVPVQKPLHVIRTGRDLEERYVLRHFDVRADLRERLRKSSQRPQQLPSFARR